MVTTEGVAGCAGLVSGIRLVGVDGGRIRHR